MQSASRQCAAVRRLLDDFLEKTHSRIVGFRPLGIREEKPASSLKYRKMSDISCARVGGAKFEDSTSKAIL